MLEYLRLFLIAVRAALSSRGDLVAENLVLHQQLVVLTRPTGKRPRLRCRGYLAHPVLTSGTRPAVGAEVPEA